MTGRLARAYAVRGPLTSASGAREPFVRSLREPDCILAASFETTTWQPEDDPNQAPHPSEATHARRCGSTIFARMRFSGGTAGLAGEEHAHVARRGGFGLLEQPPHGRGDASDRMARSLGGLPTRLHLPAELELLTDASDSEQGSSISNGFRM
jgi:hypothetical protein